ncbi:MAG: patatin-like phospholipase family protein [Pseudomonadota bacterium]
MSENDQIETPEAGDGGQPLAQPKGPTTTKQGGIALALGGGAARGWSHIGVMRALDEAKIPVKMIAGTSIGALVGACYLAGKLDELEDFALSLTQRRIIGFLDFSLRGAGLISGFRLAERMDKHLGELRIEDLPKPLVCVATEITTGHEVWLSQGPLIEAIRASYALPGVFEPVLIGDRLMVDGALVNPVPVPVCRAYESDAVVAVNLSSDVFGRGTVVRDLHTGNPAMGGDDLVAAALERKLGKKADNSRMGRALGFTGVMVQAFNIIQDRIARSRLAGDPPDLTVRPRVGDIGLSEFHRARETIDLGYEAARHELPRMADLAIKASSV